ncbi:MAG: hypothetical protein AB7V13_31290 [Pseudorhodoplanes sp.]
MSREMPGRRNGEARRLPAIDVPIIAAVSGMVLVLVVAKLPEQLVLPGISALALAVAAIAACGGWLMQAEKNIAGITIFDFSGACILVGIAAGVFSDPYRILEFFGAAIASP